MLQRLRIASLMLALTLASTATAHAEQQGEARMSFSEVDSWGYQLQNVQPGEIAGDGFDVLVVDYSRDGTDQTALGPQDVAKLRHRQGQPDRLVLAYLSIGEAEDYRFYWQDSWVSRHPAPPGQQRLPKGFLGAPDGKLVGKPLPDTPLATLASDAPPWLAGENPEWHGNYLVRYWDKDWQSIILGSPGAYLDKILAAGFDGVYLDKIDANDDWQKERPSAEREMMDFVKAIANYARARRPGFIVVPQNAEELLEFGDYVAAIDGIAKEDLLFGGGQRTDGAANPEQEIAESVARLELARAAGKGVLVVEYLDDQDTIGAARARIKSLGYVPFFARRALDAPPTESSDKSAPR